MRWPSRHRRRRVPSHRGRVALAMLAVLVAGCGLLATPGTVHVALPPPPPLPQGTPSGRPNIVFILTDDLSWNLVRYMPQVRRMEREGMTFDNYTVTDSLCCPSRATIFTGDFPHDTKVFTNTKAHGGFATFHRRGEERRTYAAVMQRQAGYRTSMLGKYLNGYEPYFTMRTGHPYVPPGWSSWNVAGDGYHEFNYHLATDQGVKYYGSEPRDYLTHVISDRAVQFVRSAVRAHTPFVAELSTFAPHGPFVPAPRDAHSFPGLRAPHSPTWNRLPTHAPGWLASLTPLGRGLRHRINRDFRLRVQSVQAVNRMIAAIREAVRASGAARNTYFVFTSDNGFHLGDYRLGPGKETAFDTDVRVPLVVVGPGVPADVRSEAVVQNTDLAPTFDQIAGVAVPRLGRRAQHAPSLARGAHPALADRGADRAPRTGRVAARPRPADHSQRRPAVLRRAADAHLHVRRVPGRATRVLQPRPRPVRAAQHVRPARSGPPRLPARRDQAPRALSRRTSLLGGRPSAHARVPVAAGARDRLATRPPRAGGAWCLRRRVWLGRPVGLSP